MRIRFKRSWRGYQDGQRVDFADGMANVLVARGIAEPDGEPERVAVAQAPAAGAVTLVPPAQVEIVQRGRKRG